MRCCRSHPFRGFDDCEVELSSATPTPLGNGRAILACGTSQLILAFGDV